MGSHRHRILKGCLLLSGLWLGACQDSGQTADMTPPDQSSAAVLPSDYHRLPERSNAFGAAVLGDRLYVHGGHIGDAHNSSIDALLRGFRRLDLGDPQALWKDVNSPNVPIQQSSLVVYQGRIHRLGGLTAKNRQDQAKDLYTLSDFAVYDDAADSWQELPGMPTTRASQSATVIDDVLYVIGGWKISGGTGTQMYHQTWLSLDLTQKPLAWQEHAQPFLVRDHCAGTAGGKLYVLGGMHSGMFPSAGWVYDPKADRWDTGPDLPAHTPVQGFGCAAVSLLGTIFFTAADGVVFRLNAAGTGWDQVAPMKVPRAFHALVARSEHELIALGGAVGADSQPIDSVESIPLR